MTGAVVREISEPGLAGSLARRAVRRRRWIRSSISTLRAALALLFVAAACAQAARSAARSARRSPTTGLLPATARAARRGLRDRCAELARSCLALACGRRVGRAAAAARCSACTRARDRASTSLRGRRHIDCGCVGAGGAPADQRLAGRAQRRSLAAAALALALVPVAARALVWLDACTVVAAPPSRSPRCCARGGSPARDSPRARRACGRRRDDGARRLERRPLGRGRRARRRRGGARAPDRRALRARRAGRRADAGPRAGGRRRGARGRRRRTCDGGARDARRRRATTGASTLLFFLSPTCPVCKTLLPVAALDRAPRARVGSTSCSPATARAPSTRRSCARERLEAFPYVLSPPLGLTYQVGEAAVRRADRRGRASCARRASSTRASTSRACSRRRSAASRRSRTTCASAGRAQRRRRRAMSDVQRAGSIGSSSAARAALARRTSRRSFLARLGAVLVGGAAFPLLPVARAAEDDARLPAPSDAGLAGDVGDPTSCDYWRHCAIDGFLCACCGGIAERVSAGHRDVADHLDRHLPQSRRRQGLRHLVQRLLRAVALHALPLHRAPRARSPSTTRRRTTISCGASARRAARSTARSRSCSAWRRSREARRRRGAALPVLLAGARGGRRRRRTRRASTTRSTARAATAPTARARRAACRPLAARSRASSRCRAAATTSSACRASRRRRSTTPRSPRCSTGCSTASTPRTCPPASRRTPRPRSAGSGAQPLVDVEGTRKQLLDRTTPATPRQ